MANHPAPQRQAAETVEAAMKAADQSINGLADATGIPYSTLRRKIKGHAEFTLGDLLLVAEALDVNPATLLPSAFSPQAVA